jgi:hypothetical protein
MVCSIQETGDWKVARTRRQERLRYLFGRAVHKISMLINGDKW